MEMGHGSFIAWSFTMDSRCSTSTSGGRDGATTCARCQGIRGSPSNRSRSRPRAAILLKCLVAQHPSPSWLLSGTTSPARYDASPRRLGSRVHPEPAGARAADRGPAVTQRAESAVLVRLAHVRRPDRPHILPLPALALCLIHATAGREHRHDPGPVCSEVHGSSAATAPAADGKRRPPESHRRQTSRGCLRSMNSSTAAALVHSSNMACISAGTSWASALRASTSEVK